jgi:hypothetical protein
VTLSNAGGGASIAPPTFATVTIADDDAALGSGDPPAGSDRTAPQLTLAAKRIQPALKAKLLALTARCNEPCKLAAVAKLRIGKKKIGLSRAKATAPPGKAAKVKLKLSRKALGTLRKAMKRGRPKVLLSVRAADAAGNTTAASRSVTVKR